MNDQFDVATNENMNILLSDGYSVSQPFFDDIQEQVEAVLPALERGQRYTSKMLCGKEFWTFLEKGERLLAGRCIARMVVKNILPLTFAKPTSSHSMRYQLK